MLLGGDGKGDADESEEADESALHVGGYVLAVRSTRVVGDGNSC